MAFSFLKKGAASVQAATQQKKEAEERKTQQYKLFRFFLKDGETCPVTFVDGDLDKEGFLVPPRYYEHNIKIHGKWQSYVCPEKTNPDANDKCPICESGDRPALVALFTVIDHREFTRRDKTKGKDTKKLMVVKPTTFELLNKLAVKRGGLAGCTFDVSRVGDKAAAVGSLFDFTVKKPIAELQSIYMRDVVDPKTNVKTKETYFTPADYETEIDYLTGAELMAKGFVKGGIPTVAQAAQQSETEVEGEQTDYSKEL